MIVSINQPAYLPWLGYFERIAKSDLHIVLDDVQFEKNSFTNRNKIRTAEGWSWLTVPVQTKGKFGDLVLKDLRTANTLDWRRKHWQSLRLNYSKAPKFVQYGTYFEEIYATQWRKLTPLMMELTHHLLRTFAIRTRILFSSELGVSGRKSDLVLNLCRAVQADVYLSGPLGRHYLDEPSFTQAGISVLYHDYQHPTYQQVHGDFVPYMAAVDLLFNHGEDSSAILCAGRELAA